MFRGKVVEMKDRQRRPNICVTGAPKDGWQIMKQN